MRLRMPLRVKLIAGYAVALGFLIAMAIFTYAVATYFENRLIPARASIYNVNHFVNDLKIHEQYFFDREVVDANNSLFFDEGISTSIYSWGEKYAALIDELARLEASEKSLDLSDRHLIVQMRQVITLYRDSFYQVTDLYQRRGFYDFGLEGELRDQAHRLEELAAGDTYSLYLITMARRYEKDFFMRGDQRSLMNARTAMDNLEMHLSANTELLALAQGYVATFEEIVALEETIGLTYDQGLRGELFRSTLRLEPMVEDLEEQVLGQTEDTLAFLRIQLLVFTVAALVFGVILMVYIVRSVLRSLSELTRVAVAVTAGDFSQRVPEEGNDEISALGHAFNLMTNEIQKTYASLSERNDQLGGRVGELEDTKKAMAHLLGELRETQEGLEREKAKDEAILSSIGDGVMAVDLKGEIILLNRVAEDLMGYSATELLGKNYREKFILKKERKPDEAYPDFIQDVIQEGAIKNMANHTVLIRKDGSALPIADSAAPLRGDGGKIFGAIVVFRDATKERSLEQAKDDFLSIASHQLRTPLGSMRWNLEFLLGGDGGEMAGEVKERLEQVYESNLRINTLVGDLLNVSRIDQGRVKDEPSDTDIGPIILAAINEMAPIAITRNVKLEFKGKDQSIPSLHIDPKRFREVMQNLLSNAVKYNRPQGTVTASLEVLKDTIKISIVDTGIGIPPEDEAMLFSKFFRAKNVTVQETEGNGLGLFVVKSYVEGWGGTISFKSKLNVGSTFIITLPVLKKVNREEYDRS